MTKDDNRPDGLKNFTGQAAQGKARFQEMHDRIIAATLEILSWCDRDRVTISLIQSKAQITRVTFNKHFSSAKAAVEAAERLRQ